MDNSTLPRISFGMIVLNGEPFIRYNLKALYPFAHEIIIVEGACPTARAFATNDGHSTDGTLDVLRRFQVEEDPQKKLVIITGEKVGQENGFWSEKDEMSQAYARRATGDYLWQVDVDEFYRPEDIQAIITMLQGDPGIKAVSFRALHFWGAPWYRTDGIHLRNGAQDYHRLFAWVPGYKYTTHRPPTVVDENGQDIRMAKALTAEKLAHRGIYLYHYALLFPFQANFKLAYYGKMDALLLPKREAWHRNYFCLSNPFLVDDTSVLGEPSWLLRFKGQHPTSIHELWQDIEDGRIQIERRPTQDIEQLLNDRQYQVTKVLLAYVWKSRNWLMKGSDVLRQLARKWKLTRYLRMFLKLLYWIVGLQDIVLSGFRLLCFSLPYISTLAKKRWSLERLDSENGVLCDRARLAQFRKWYPEDPRGQITWYGSKGWRTIVPEPHLGIPQSIGGNEEHKTTLLVAGRAFFESQASEAGKHILSDAMESLKYGDYLLIYAPHEFAFGGASQFAWVPNWKSLYQLAKVHGEIRVKNFNAGFDRNGFFHFVMVRQPRKSAAASAEKKAEIGAGRYFYMNAGSSRLHGHSNRVLSSAGLRALRHFAKSIKEHYFLDRIPEEANVKANDIAMGHYGPWITTARQRGALTILYGPGDRFKERSEPYYADMQSRGTFPEQYLSSYLVIMQAGGFWRIESPWTYPGLCRWIDVPVSAAVFPRTKKQIAPSGRRTFCFIGLYNEQWKGSVTARKIMERCPDLRFIAIRCEPFGLPNCKEYPKIDNRLNDFRRVVSQADYIVVPSREDSQPGTVAECSSLGLLPIVSEFAGYVLSFPNRIDVDDLDQCAATLRAAQTADEETVRGWQILNASYIEQFHRPERCESLLRFYIEEACSEFYNNRDTCKEISV